ncbi:transposase [Escherichia coli]|uniref:transposase n=1 Tax=Escherichia coli TaxID=562 RepID=UPI00098ADF1D|nr:transposase [Escherichia coli]
MELKTRRETSHTLAQLFQATEFQKGYTEGLQTVRLAQRLLSKGMHRAAVAEVTALSLAGIHTLMNSI